MLVLDIAKRLNREDCNKHIKFDFTVDEGAKSLKLFFEYTPPYLEDKEKSRQMIEQAFIGYMGEIDPKRVDNYLPLRNLLTISVSSPDGWIGTAHRHLKILDYYINEEKASRGFHPTRIIAGKWSITVSIYSVLTDYVDMQLIAEVEYD